MRQRRIDRVLLRADAALAAGSIADARDALEELERLSPEALEVATLRARLDQLDQPVVETRIPDLELRPAVVEPADRPPQKRRWMPSVAAALLVLGLSAWFALPRTSPPTAPDVVEFTKPASVVPEITTQPVEPVAATPSVQVSVDEVAATKTVEPPVLEQPQRPLATFGRDIPSARSTRENIPARAEIRSMAAPAPVDPSPAASVPPEVPVASAATPFERPPAESPPVSAPPVPAPLPAPVSPTISATSDAPSIPTRPVLADDAGVRSTLAQYASAYSRLDVDAAGAVWPGVDRRALARAFDGLASQRVNLGSCDVRIVGEAALAECSGSATWSPKIGGGSHSQQRRWQFRLRNTSSGWQIVSATAR